MSMKPTHIKQEDEKLKKIIETNPLHKWRKENEESLRSAGLYLGVTPAAVQGWEAGIYYPTDESFRAIARVMKMDVEEIQRQWQLWNNRKARLLEHV